MAADVVLSDVKAQQPPRSRVVIAAAVGNVPEWFDCSFTAISPWTSAEVFFQPAIRLFRSVRPAYVVRPLGAAMIGAHTYSCGRKAGLTLSIVLMMIGTTMMVVTPSYGAIGLVLRF